MHPSVSGALSQRNPGITCIIRTFDPLNLIPAGEDYHNIHSPKPAETSAMTLEIFKGNIEMVEVEN